MTEFEQFKAMLNRVNASYTLQDESDRRIFTVENMAHSGYAGFCSCWEFHNEGNLIHVSHWEG